MSNQTGIIPLSKRQQIWALICLGAGVSILVFLVLLKLESDGKAAVSLGDIAIALVPIVIFLFATGQITKLGIGPQGLTVERATEAFRAAASRDASEQMTELPVEELEMGEKGAAGALPRLVQSQPQALRFRLGWNGYFAPIVRSYIEALSMNPRFQYLVFLSGDGSFFGLVEAQKLLSLIAARARADFEMPDPAQIEEAENQQWMWFTDMIVADRGDELAATLPGFVKADQAILEGANTREALGKLEEAKADTLPFVRGDGKLAGVVERQRLVASLVLQVTSALEATNDETRQAS